MNITLLPLSSFSHSRKWGQKEEMAVLFKSVDKNNNQLISNHSRLFLLSAFLIHLKFQKGSSEDKVSMAIK